MPTEPTSTSASATARPASDNRKPDSKRQEHERKQRVLTKGRASITTSIAEAVVIKDGDVFFLSDRDGNVPLDGTHGLGLYYRDCRFLNGYELRLDDVRLDTLSANAARGFMAVHQLTNPDLRMRNGRLIQKEELGLKWERTIDSGQQMLCDQITFQNFSQQPIQFPISLSFNAGFEDVFEVRGLLGEHLGHRREPTWQDGRLVFLYDGADGLYRALTVGFAPAPTSTDGTTAHFDVRLPARGASQLVVTLALAESADLDQITTTEQRRPDLAHSQSELHRSAADWLGDHVDVQADSVLLNRLMNRSLRDLRVLRSTLRGKQYFAAGVPWFVTLFGRDSLIAALESLAYNPDIAAQTLRLVASYQGQTVDDWRDEQPGKILHELRVGEMARLNEIPQTPYYGTIDATPLFLILLSQHAAWTGDLSVFNELRANVELALVWMDEYGDGDGDGYLEYASTSKKGLVNQGWKDSGDAIVNADGTLARPPIALVEVQGYVYRAKLELAGLYERAGEADRAERLRHEAGKLRERFNRDYWLPDLDCFALALQAGHEPCAVVSSNPGQALWGGIVDVMKARKMTERLLRDDMFNGWGVRTLSADATAYNPVGYHLGTVWPHDNALIATGFRTYGHDDAFQRVFTGIVEAALHFPDYRLPEVFSGFSRQEYSIPVRYPVACHPQAWAAGAIPYMLTAALGLRPEGFAKRLCVRRPILPDFVSELDLRRLRVGGARADLRFARGDDGVVTVEATNIEGELDINVEQDEPS